MIVLIYGTTGELIKILPLIKLVSAKQQFRISTEQQPIQLKNLHKEANTPNPDLKLANGRRGKDLEKIPDMILWLKDIVSRYLTVRRTLKRLKKDSAGKLIVIVHGDTVTTVLGTIIGRLQRLPVAHIEAGLRSGNWRHPFPEELDRRITSKFATVNFAPGADPVENLRQAGSKGEIINTRYNTVLDSLRLARSQNRKIIGISKLPAKYFVVSLHRNELMARPDELRSTLESIAGKAKKTPAIFLDHPVTKERIRNLKLDHILGVKNITRLNKLEYFQFISLIAKCEFIVTDSGGLQEESAYLGIPCLVHRLTTERKEGLGQNVVLSEYDDKKLVGFLKNPERYRTGVLDSDFSPTQVIVDSLKDGGYLAS